MSPTLGLSTVESKTNFRPGERISGKAMWIAEKEPAAVELRLFWYTEGKGDQDVEVVDVKTISSPGLKGEAEFNFIAPTEPCSFSGKLISVSWAVELVLLPKRDASLFKIYISPSGQEISLHG